MNYSLRSFAISEIGLVRTNNQDSAYVSPSLAIVADGMGGAAAGDLASSVAIRELVSADKVNRDPETRLAGEDMLEVLGGALTRANDTLADLVVSDHSLEGMGTTACGAMFSGTHFGLCHIGDSRGYLLRDGELTRLTRDHSWVQSLLDDGKLTPEEAAVHPQRSLLMRVLNGQPTHKPDLMTIEAQLGDRVLFCSDGLAGLVSDDVISHILKEPDQETAVERLKQAAFQAGGNDNISIIVSDVVEYSEALEAAAPQVLGAAQTVSIPEPQGVEPIDLGDSDLPHDDTEPSIPAAPAPKPAAAPPRVAKDTEEEMRYRPQEAGARRRWLPVLIVLLALTILVVAGVIFMRQVTSSQFFIGPDGDNVAIYQGVPDPLPLMDQPRLEETSDIKIEDLPPYYAGQVRDHKLVYPSLEEAQTQVDHLDELAERCIVERSQPDDSPNDSTSEPTGRPDLEDCG